MGVYAMLVGQVGLLILNSIPLLQLSEAACPFTVDETQKWKNKGFFESANLAVPNYSVAKVGSGFNRTLNLDGMCNSIVWKSDSFTCAKKKGEWHATVSKPNGVLLKFDNANCALHGVTVARTKPGSPFEAELRLQFFPCNARTGTAAPPVSAAAVSIGLQKEGTPAHSGNDANLKMWMDDVCNVKPTSSPQQQITTEVNYNMTHLGNGTCDSTILEFNSAITVSGCKTACGAAAKKAKIAGLTGASCTGFAFNEALADKKCVLYNTSISVAQISSRRLTDPFSVPGWECYDVKVTDTANNKVTPAPTGYEEYALEKGLREELRMKDVMGGKKETMREAILHQVDPPVPFCFEGTWWFSLQDSVGNPAHISINQENWDEVMKNLPPYVPETTGVDSQITIDRVLVQTCVDISGWGRNCVMPEARKTCDSVQLINSIITGLVTPILSWLVVYGVYKLAKGGDQLGEGPEASKAAPKCTVAVVVICTLTALIVPMLVSYVLSLIIEKFLAQNCFHESREQFVVWLGSGGAASVAMMVGVVYLWKSSQLHSQIVDPQPSHSSAPEGQKWAAGLVSANGQDVEIINEDVYASANFASARGGSAMASNFGSSYRK